MSDPRLELVGVIGQEVYAEQVKSFLEGADGRPVVIAIDSPGGVLSEGVLIHNMLQAYSGQVTTVVLARAYSIASYIFLAGDTRIMMDNALLMTHEARVDMSSMTVQSAEQAIGMLNAANKSIRKAYAKAMGIDENMVQTLWDAGGDIWYDSTEAYEAGLATTIQEASAPLLASYTEELMALAAPARIINISKEKVMEKVSIDQLEALGAPADFIVAQLKAESTLVEAQAAYIALLKAEFEKDEEEDEAKAEEKEDDMDAMEEDEKDVEAKEDMDEEKPEAFEKEDDKDEAKAEEEKDEAKAEEEEEEEEGEAKADEDGQTIEANLSNLAGAQPVATTRSREVVTARSIWNSKIEELTAKGFEHFKAVARVAKENPQLRQEMIDEANN